MKTQNLMLLLVTMLMFGNLTAQNYNVDKTFEGVEKVEIEIAVGDLEVKSAKGADVDVKGLYNEKDLKVKIEKRGNKLVIIEQDRRKNSKDNSQWILYLPSGLELEANLGVGDVTLAQFSGELEGNNGTGNISFDNCMGDLKWNSGTGNIKVENCQGDLNFNTGTGSVELTHINGEIRANSGTGQVNLSKGSGGFTANSGTGSVRAAELAINEDSKFASGTGTVELQLSSSSKADIKVNSGTGNARVITNGHSLTGVLTMTCGKRSGEIKAPFSFDKEWVEGEGRNQTLHKTKKFDDSDVTIKVGSGTGRAMVK